MYKNFKFTVLYSFVIVSLSSFYISIEAANALDVNCSQNVSLQDGQVYNIQNHGYPDRFFGTEDYTWCIQTQKNIRITCDEIDTPLSKNCKEHSISVKVPRRLNNRYCGMRNASIEISTEMGNKIIVRFNSSDNSIGSKFRCALEEMKEEDKCCETGRSNSTDSIVGGQPADDYEFPMMAGIVDVSEQIQILCGGSIISSRHVLTAAHCLFNRKDFNLRIVVGEHDVTTNLDRRDTKIYRIYKFILHPRYTAILNINDIAIVVLNENMRYTSTIGPVNLPIGSYQGPHPHTYVRLAGWGSTKYGFQPSKILQKVDVQIVSNYECRRYWPNLNNKELCTFAHGKDACQFDSGGPVLYWDQSRSTWILVGIINYGRNCGTNTPGVNLRVASYIPWIQSLT